MSDNAAAIEAAASRLREARLRRCPCAPVRDLIGTVEDAYAVQAANNARALEAGARRVGWKVGLTSDTVQAQLGVDQPDFGMLLADMEVGTGRPIPTRDLLQPKVEAEVAFVLHADLGHRSVTVVDVLSAVAYAVPAIEVVDSRIESWDIALVDTVADNASSGMYVLGGRPVPLTDVDVGTVTMEMTGPDGDVLSQGSGQACLGHPLNAVVWLANTLAGLGSPLRAGDLVLSGALGPMVTVTPGATYHARIDGLGSVSAHFEEIP